MKKKNYLFAFIPLFLWILCGVNQNAYAQPSNDAPFTSSGNLRINTVEPDYITIQFPFYDEVGDNGNHRYITYDGPNGGATLYYSTNGGASYNELLYIRTRGQNRDSWYWIDLSKASSSFNLITTYPAPGYGKLGGDGQEKNIDKYGGSFFNQHFNKENSAYASGVQYATYAAIKWKFSNTLTNAVVRFKITGNLGKNGTSITRSFEWTTEDIVIGNPMHTPTISGHEFLADGKLKINYRIPNFNVTDDNGTWDGANKTQVTCYYPGTTTLQQSSWNNTFTTGEGLNITTTDKLTSTQLLGGTTKIKHERMDRYRPVTNAGSSSTYVARGTYYTSVTSDVYTIPPFPQPQNLNASLSAGKVTLSWTMAKGTDKSPTAGYSFQWRKKGGTWADIKDVTKTYSYSETACSVSFDYPEYNKETGNYEFRIKRASLNWGVFDATTTIDIATDLAKLNSITADGNASTGITLNWTRSEGVVKSNWKIRITRKDVITGTSNILTSNLTIDTTIGKYTDANAPACKGTIYTVEILDGTNPVSEISSQEVVRPNGDVGSIAALSVSKGYYNDRVAVTWTTSANAGFSRYSLSRKELGVTNAVEQQITEITASNLSQYRFDDNTAIQGTYYEYIVKAWVDCAGKASMASEKKSTGFMQPFGVVSGKVSYSGNTAVEGATVLAAGQSGYANKSMIFNSSEKTYIQTPYKTSSLSANDFTFQAWIKHRGESATRALLSSNYRYNVNLLSGGKLQLQYYNNAGTAYSINFDTVIPTMEYKHVSISYTVTTAKAITTKLYIDGKLKETKTATFTGNIGFKAPLTSGITLYNYIGYTGSGTTYFNGYIDELRLWNKVLTNEEIAQNYDRYISGKEVDLALYYRFDETAGNEIFDNSGRNGNFNENHGTISGGLSGMRSEYEVPTASQLAIKAVTDANGNYIINTIPYTGDGNTFIIKPLLGIHTFSPTDKPLFFSNNSATHNNIDFTDVSSFKVSGTVMYEGGNYPVEGCTFKVDGKPLVDQEGMPITSDANGEYKIEVPIGVHEVKVEKSGHTFVSGGLALEGGKNRNYQDDVTRLNFYDQTLVKVVGRFVGGKREHQKNLGFGESYNNIGADSVIFVAKKDQYKLSANSENQAVTVKKTFYHNNGEWKKSGNVSQDSTLYQLSGNRIKIKVSPATGEFVAWLPPVAYSMEAVKMKGYNEALFTAEEMDLSNTPVSDPKMMKSIVRTWVDSVDAVLKENELPHKVAVEHADTIYCHQEWARFYQSIPSFSVQQLVENKKVNYWGDSIAEFTPVIGQAAEKVTLYNTNKTYTFGLPVFTQSSIYTFDLKAYESYKNNTVNPVVEDIVPVNGGVVRMNNTMDLTQIIEIELDSNGLGKYEFLAGAPDLTTGQRQFEAVVIIDGIGYRWNSGNEPVITYLLGSKSTGTDFMTAGPDDITAVVHDPPGSKSKAFIEKGTTITKKRDVNITEEAAMAMLTIIEGGATVTTFAGLGAGVITEMETSIKGEIGVTNTHNFKEGFSTEDVSEFTERFETSDDPIYVGHNSDVFLGNSTNIQYGYTNGISLVKASDIADPADIFIQTGDYALAKTNGIAFGQTFGTFFAYTEYEIESIMIPKWKNNLKQLFVFSKPTQAQVDALGHPVYYSKLAVNHPNFGKSNDDKVFGAAASKGENYYNGPSYETMFPTTFKFTTKNSDGKTESYVDSVSWYNQQIDRWVEVLADNEKDKVEMEKIGNYSFGAGVSIDWANKKATTKSSSFEYTFILAGEGSTDAGFKINGSGMSLKTTISTKLETNVATSAGTTDSKTAGFHLQDDGDDDEISVDYGWTKYGTIGFKSRGGRTCCPYEGERKTKYYQPGQHILSEGSMQIEVPKIDVKGQTYALKVPSTKQAVFTLEMKNESETGEDVWFKLLVDEATNPYGAEIKIDGIGIGNGRRFLVPAGGILEKTMTIVKNPNYDKYENIRLLLTSECQYDPTNGLFDDIFDETYVSVEFQPACSDVNIKAPVANWVMNSSTGQSMSVILDGYNINHANFGYVELQYKPSGSASWNNLTRFYANQDRYNAADVNNKILLGSSDNNIVYNWDTKDLVDGRYDVRARSVCETQSGVFVTEYITPAVSGIKDMVRPVVFGKAQPSDGVLRGNNDLSIQFNEEINEGLVTKNNFSIRGIQNGIKTNHFTAAHFDGQSGYMATEQEISLEGKSFTVELWAKRNALGAATLFSHGTGSETFSIGFGADNKLQVSVGATTVTGTNSITNTTEWGYYAVVYNATTKSVTAYYMVGSNTQVEMDGKPAGSYTGNGPVFVACQPNLSNFAAVDMHELKIWNKALALAQLTFNKTLSGNENGMLAYWPMNEGKGTLVQEKSRAKNGMLNASWQILPEGKAITLNGTDNYFDINTGSTVAITQDQDFSIELWFKGDNASGGLFSCGRGDGGTPEIVQDKLSIYVENGVLTVGTNGAAHKAEGLNYMDNKWHHLAFAVNRTGMGNLFVDGNLVHSIDAAQIGTLASEKMTFGARKWKELVGGSLVDKSDMFFKGNIDEVRIWNMALTQEYINTYANIRLNGDEAGLVAYYPFDKYITNTNDKKELAFSKEDQTVGTSATASTLTAAETSEIAPIKDAGPIVEYDFDFVTNKDKVVLNLRDKIDAIENTHIIITAREIQDLHGNTMGAAHAWHAYIDRSFLKWEDNSIVKSKKNNESLSFTVKIVNTGGLNESFTIENIPNWLDVSPTSGSVSPTSSKEIKFTVHEGLNPGNHEEVLALKGNYTNMLNLRVNVGGDKPNWDVNPYDYENSMSIVGQIKINNIISSDENDMVGAFINGVCVGVASPKYVKNMDLWQVSLNIYYSTDNNAIEFRIWDASAGKIYAQVKPQDIQFKANTVNGSPTEPVLFETTGTLMNTIDLSNGWNWVSFNVNSPALANANQLMQSITNGLEIKGQNTFSRYEKGFWTNGSMNNQEFTNTQMYMVKMTGNNVISLSGEQLDPTATTISLTPGWNWISYIPQVNMTVIEAFAGLNPIEGDVVKSQFKFAVYDSRLGWVGNLEYLKTGLGYMYKTTQNSSFHYPKGSSLQTKSAVAEKPALNAEIATRYENNLSLIGEVSLGYQLPESALLVAKVNGEIRGVADMQKVGDKHLYFISIHADYSNEAITFSVENNGETTVLNEKVVYKKDAVVGTLNDPMVFTQATDNLAVYPNPFSNRFTIEFTAEKDMPVQIEIQNVAGITVYKTTSQSKNDGRQTLTLEDSQINGLPNGIYILRLMMNGKVISTKLIKQ